MCSQFLIFPLLLFFLLFLQSAKAFGCNMNSTRLLRLYGKYKNRTNVCYNLIISTIYTFFSISICTSNAHFFNYISSILLYPFSSPNNYTPTRYKSSLKSSFPPLFLRHQTPTYFYCHPSKTRILQRDSMQGRVVVGCKLAQIYMRTRNYNDNNNLAKRKE